MEIQEFVDEGLGNSSYLISFDRKALVIDPPRFPTAIEQRASQLGATIAWTADTHSHADYVTGSPALATRHHAAFLAPAASDLESAHQPLGDGEAIELVDSYSLREVATPGHTPDHMAYVLCRAGDPVAVFSGGSLMVGTIGRTDLGEPDLARPLARAMFVSLRRVDDLADDVAVYPTHGAGSLRGAPGSSGPVFASWAGLLIEPEQDMVFVLDPGQDRGDLVRQCLDVRQANEYETGHLPGAANIELGTITQAAAPDCEVTVMCGHGERAMTAASLLTACSNVAVSVFDGGPDTWAEATGNELETGS